MRLFFHPPTVDGEIRAKKNRLAGGQPLKYNQLMGTPIDFHLVEGEISLTVDYVAGEASAIAVLSGATQMIAALDALDRALLSSVDTELEPVSILNDVQHSSLKVLLARALRRVPDESLASGDWKKWAGALLVKGKHLLLSRIDADAPAIAAAVDALKQDYADAPGLLGYQPPTVAEAQAALAQVRQARRLLSGSRVVIQSDMGAIVLPDLPVEAPIEAVTVEDRVTNRGREWLKVRYPDMLGQAQWTVQRAGRSTRVTILHTEWLEAYHRREVHLLPGDAIDCDYEETIEYDAGQNELTRTLAVICVHGIKSPPRQQRLI